MPENVDIWVCFDEIHKMPKWKNILKDFFDTHEKKVNFIALELKARIDLWNDICEDKYSLSFIKTRDGRETDFLILKNSQPYFLCEVKLSDTDITRHHYSHSQYLGGIPFVQIVRQPNILKVERNKFYVVSASRFF